ncbi:MAG: hypothetical protein ACE5K4_02560 [Candidatus Hydrothermarchaeota archaeon]
MTEKSNEELKKCEAKLNALTILVGGLSRSMEAVMGKGGRAVAYKMGRDGGKRIAKKLGKAESIKEAITKLTSEIGDLYDIEIKENGDEIELTTNYCYIREVIKKRQAVGLKPAGTLCRVTRGYLESVIEEMTGKKVQLKLIESDLEKDFCKVTLKG